jgi:hypothetical protein
MNACVCWFSAGPSPIPTRQRHVLRQPPIRWEDLIRCLLNNHMITHSIAPNAIGPPSLLVSLMKYNAGKGRGGRNKEEKMEGSTHTGGAASGFATSASTRVPVFRCTHACMSVMLIHHADSLSTRRSCIIVLISKSVLFMSPRIGG